ncbi:hypothetical protein C8R44DRAFT_973355 [Mycena epipterygia]|nr:hypothetical protein C8R44DRAFT_973355 [Mycena epipterygia]
MKTQADPTVCAIACDRLSCISSETLATIFRYLAPCDVKSVALVCRRLHRLSISILFKANGILDATVTCQVTLDGDSDLEAEYFDALAALQLALFIPSIGSFMVTFTGSGDTIRMARGMRRCQRLIYKFRSLREITIDFKSSTYDPKFLVNWRMGDPLKSDFECLLNEIAHLPTLSSFQVVTGWHFDTTYMLELFPCIHSASPPGNSSLVKRSRISWTDLFPRKTPTSASHAPIAFLIDTPILVLPSLYAWTMSFLSSRLITTLRLHMLVAAVDWAVILAEIADSVPQLTEFTILGVCMPATELISSVSRFQQLTHLTTDSTADFVSEASFRMISPKGGDEPSPKRRIPRFWESLRLKNLTTLATRPAHLEVLLRGRKPLPALTSLCVRLELLHMNSKSTMELMRKILLRLRRSHHKSLPLTLDVQANISPEALMCRTLDVALSQGILWDSAFEPVEHLRVRDFGDHSWTILARWAALFRRATSLSLAGNRWPSGRWEMLMVTEVHRMCPTIQTITVGDVEYYRATTDTSPREVAKAATTGFIDLPDDVLLIVFRNLSAELYALSRLSRRLHLLALPLYLAHKWIPDPSEICEFRLVNHPTAADVLASLNSSLFLRQVTRVSCQFTSGGSISCYVDHIARLTAFLAKFPSMEAVSLSLADLSNVDSEVNDVVRQKWRVVFGRLLNVILERRCTALTIRGAPYLQPGTLEPPWPSADETLRLSSSAHANSSIRSFSFHPETHLSYSGTLWTFSVLRFSKISSLTVSIISASLVDIIAQELPNLPELTITSCSELLDAKLMDLLSKLTALTRLTLPPRLGIGIRARAPFTDRIVPSFPHLQALIAPPPFIVHFLLGDNPLPALLTLEIRASYSLPREWTILKVLAALCARLRGPMPAVTLDIAFTYATRFLAWWTTGGLERLVGDAEVWRDVSKLVGTLKLRGSTVRDQAHETCALVLPAIARSFPALRHLWVDDGGRPGVPAWEAALESFVVKCSDIESVYIGSMMVYSKSGLQL